MEKGYKKYPFLLEIWSDKDKKREHELITWNLQKRKRVL